MFNLETKNALTYHSLFDSTFLLKIKKISYSPNISNLEITSESLIREKFLQINISSIAMNKNEKILCILNKQTRR